MPEWADRAVLSGEQNAYFDAKQAAAALSLAQKAGLPSLIASVEPLTEGLTNGEAMTAQGSLETIALRVQPGITANAGKAWAAALVDSFRRVPGDILSKGIAAARVRQFQFLNEVGPFIQEEIGEPMRARYAKLSRLRQIHAAAQLPASRLEREPISDEEHAETMRRINAPRADAGPSRGITDEDRKAWRAGLPTPGAAAAEARALANVNMVRAINGQAAWSREEWTADSVALANARCAERRAKDQAAA